MNRLFDGFVSSIKDITGCEFGVADESGVILSCSDAKTFEGAEAAIDAFLDSEDLWRVENGVRYYKVVEKEKPEYVIFMSGDGEIGEKFLEIAAISVHNIKLYYEEKYDKNSFIKQIILDNILPGDISIRAKELHIAARALRVAFIIRLEKNQEIYSHEIVQNLFPDRLKDFVVVIDDENTALIKELKGTEDTKEINQIAKTIIDTLNTESMIKAKIGVGTPTESISEIGRSFKEAQTALLVGGIFENDKSVINYNSLGLGRLIYQLPETLCKLFLDEVFAKGAYESLDNETILTIQKFFENNLNVSETSRLLYVHRNTLVYRLDKIQKITGLDLRNFDDAIIFKVSMLVKKYLDKGERVL
ncbi:MAG: helix-turn-helix domain-containing protein [Clostridiales bacterium]|jgi:carbohydrate diacid regulator|nr:helix-turn-helix domain-containing protein [Clostridiales bacterium]